MLAVVIKGEAVGLKSGCLLKYMRMRRRIGEGVWKSEQNTEI